ncbi:2-keto-4-pentenoate hydratase [Effusibacillus lacus]|uniref:2-keto-4-pentenoate hydratase n=1 Tax=Effusibacillus lacus TaxID=1348429 RepID=A0A292YQT0_9BACL|nr:fumarylacetoacetate hydrolase family protein [Effusibacillus lacus]TCS76940.1 2-keto-4-pentenoate hydratase [Effusibacillus lacus]GAX91269.1 2-keto-4-pentenoate hydratase [Effusibacillus lacus]
MTLPIDEIASRLEQAWQTRVPIQPLSEESGLCTVEDAYAIQQSWVRRRLATGDRITGRKIGLTSKAMQQMMGVDEPDYGVLLNSFSIPVTRGVGEVDMSRLLQPRVEGEIAFLMKKPLRGPGVTINDVFNATEAVAAAVEIVDSRIRDWKIKLVDTVADNASSGAYALGSWHTRWQDLDLALAGMVLYVDGRIQSVGAGAAALGHPAVCVSWLANKLGEMGEGIEAGDIVLSGALAGAVSVQPGQNVCLQIAGLDAIMLQFPSIQEQR